MLVNELLWESSAYWYAHDPALPYFVGWFIWGCILTLAIIFVLEGWRNFLDEYPAIRSLGMIVLGLVAVILVTIALATVPYGQSRTFIIESYLFKVTLVAERSIRFVLVGLIVAFFLFTSYLALNWKHSQFGILLGYGLYCSASLAVTAFETKMVGTGVNILASMIDATAYLLTLLLLLTYLLRLEPHRNLPIPASAKADLERWNDALSDLIHR